jgi:hypothetical protein
MDKNRQTDYEDSQDSQRGQYGYQQQPHPPQYSWQPQHAGPHASASPPPSAPYDNNSNPQQYYGEQQQRYDYAQGRPSEQYQGYPPQETYPYEASYDQQPQAPDYNVFYHDGSAQQKYTHSQSDTFPQPHGQVQPGNPEEEKGVMGALAGGAAGAYGGHKLGHHGFLGGLAGAYMGHKLEDKYKENRHHSRPHSRRSSSSSSSSPSPDHHPTKPIGLGAPHGAPTGVHLAGNFSASARQISLDGDYDLIAECGTADGHKKLSSISLNSVLTNNNGNFQWVQAGGNFGASARNVRLADGGRLLEAELCSQDGHWRHAKICLDEKIENSNGDLRLTS